MDIIVKNRLEQRLEKAREEEAKLWALHQETEKWAAPYVKKVEESLTAWCKACNKSKILADMIGDEYA